MRRLVHRKSKRTRNGPVLHYMMDITRGDVVRVVSGDDKGKEGRVVRVDRKRRRVAVEGVKIVKRHKKARSEGEESAIIEFPALIDASNVMLIDPKSGEPTRIRHKRDKDGVAERISVKSGQAISRA
ncbi:MAG: 50S ribosomal protein L24 [Gemmatimonadetes bacterium]|nr:50S ribosomal protein L24 [Gemmatimonadota bacterium]